MEICILKVILVRVQKKRGAYKAFVMIKGNTFINIMLLERNMNIKDVSCEFSEENENIALETGGKVILITKWQKT